VVAHKVASELSDYRYLKRANTLIVLSICVSRLERRLAVLLLFFSWLLEKRVSLEYNA
jgi:hypothetical protein